MYYLKNISTKKIHSFQDNEKPVDIEDWQEPTSNEKKEIELENARSGKISEIRNIASEKINFEYPIWKQNNLMSGVITINNKEILAIKSQPPTVYNISEQEAQILQAANICKQFIINIRSKSNQLEALVNTMTLEELKFFNPFDNSNW